MNFIAGIRIMMICFCSHSINYSIHLFLCTNVDFHTIILRLFTDYNQSINSPEAVRGRLLKYLIPVIISSVAFNVPKFMEARVEYYADINGTTTVFNSTIHDTDEEYEFIEWTPQVNIFKEQFLTLNLIINKRQVIYHLLCVRMLLLYKMYL